MSTPHYFVPRGGLPTQSDLTTDRARFTTAYAVLPRGTMRDIVTSQLPHWAQTRLWVIARPLSGFAETFSWYIAEVQPGGGSETPSRTRPPRPCSSSWPAQRRSPSARRPTSCRPAPTPTCHPGSPGRCAPPGTSPPPSTGSARPTSVVDGVDAPEAFVTHETDVRPQPMPGTDAWATQRFVDPLDVRHDMHVNIVGFEPGGAIPFPETHVMEHGLYVLEGKAVYLLNTDWVEVQEGDFMWLRAFCPQACYAGGPGRFRYLLYKDVNRQARLTLGHG